MTVTEFDQKEMEGWIEAQYLLGPRRPGSPAGRRNEDYLEERLGELGLVHVRKEPIPIVHWDARSFELLAGVDGRLEPVNAFPIPYTAFTKQSKVTAPMVFADSSALFQRADWRGKVVVTEIGFPSLNASLLQRVGLGVHDPDGNIKEVSHPATWVRLGWHIYREAARKGALGFVGIVRDQPGGTARMYAPYGFREKDILDKPIPGFWAARGEGERLMTLAKSGSLARLQLDGIREPGVTHNVVGEIPGKTDDAELMVLSCHHDSPFSSPVEDASGISVVLALARRFAQEEPLNRRLIVLLTAGHFYGSIGTRTFIKQHRADLERTAFEISIEHIGLEAIEDDTGSLVPTGRPEATGIFVPMNRKVASIVLQAASDSSLDRVILLPPEGPLGDLPPTDGGDWYEAKVPVINHISNPVYLLTDDDAMHWVARERLPRVAAAFAQIIRRLDDLPRREIAAVDFWPRLMAMKLLKHLVRARTTALGLKPIY